MSYCISVNRYSTLLHIAPLNESTPQDYCYKHEPRLKGRGRCCCNL